MRDVKPAAAALNTVLRIVHMGATQIENVITCRENVFANQPCAENSLGTRLVDGYGCGLGLGEFF